MSKFDEQVEQLAEKYGISDDDAKALLDASPLKAERDAARAETEAAAQRAAALEAKVRADTFAKVGVPGDPSAYNLPADLDIANEEAVAAWARTQKLIAPAQQQEALAAEQQAHEQFAAATAGAPPPPPPPGAQAKAAAMLEKVKNAGPGQVHQSSPLYQEAMETLRSAGYRFGDLYAHDGKFSTAEGATPIPR